MIKLVASAAPRAFACPASVNEESLEVRESSEPADLGSAGHSAMEQVVAGEQPDLDQLAGRWGVNRDELGRLVWYARTVWETLTPSFVGARTEVPVGLVLDDLVIRARADLLTPEARLVHGLDWKFGRQDGNYYHQLAATAACLILREGSLVHEAVLTIVWVRDQDVETYRFDRAAVEAWLEEVRHKVVGRKTYTVGPQCGFCPRSRSCPAMAASARRDVQIFGNILMQDQIKAGLADLAPAEVVALRRRAKALTYVIESLDEAVRRLVQADGPLDAGDGTELRLVDQNGPRVIDTKKAWDVLAKEFTTDELNQVFRASATRADEIVARNAGRGNGAAAKRALADHLRAADAVTQTVVTHLKEVRKGPPR